MAQNQAQDMNELFTVGQFIKKKMMQACAPLAAESGLRTVELDILYFLAQNASAGADTARDIIQARGVSKAHISKSVDNLYHGGYITLDEDEGDHRRTHIRLTAKAHALVETYRALLRGIMKALMLGVTEQERAAVRSVADKVTANANRL